jgi:Beta-ketoacyl synthase, N-terminal domain
MIVHVKGIAAIGPGFENWTRLSNHFHLGAALDAEYVPRLQATILPATERRRATPTIKLAIDVAQDALLQSGLKAEDVAIVFASANGDTNTIHQICESLATPQRMVSPTRFHNSVHNAPVGYWSIASGSRQPSTCLAAWYGTFAAALVEAATQCVTEGMPVLLAVYDTPFPEPLAAKTPGHQPFGVALVLGAKPDGSLAAMTLALDPGAQCAEKRMDQPALEALRVDSSASRALPLLAALASTAAHEEVVLDYAKGLRLKIALDR